MGFCLLPRLCLLGLIACLVAGRPWTEVAQHSGPIDWRGIASNADGSKLIATVWEGNLWTSTDSSTTWTEVTCITQPQRWLGVASSDDGLKLVAAVWGGSLWTSVNSGTTWAGVTVASFGGPKNWREMTSSADGSKLVAGVENGNLWMLTFDINELWVNMDRGHVHRRNQGMVLARLKRRRLEGGCGCKQWQPVDIPGFGATWTEVTSIAANQTWRGIER